MIVVSAYLVRNRKPVVYTLLPAVFMLVTTCAALVWKGYTYLVASSPNYPLAFAALVLLCLAVYVGMGGFMTIRRGSASDSLETAVG